MDMEKIVKLAIKGDDNAFARLMDSCKENLYRTAYAYVKNEEDALDVVQETVYKAYISIDKLKNPEYFKTWITRILINTAIDTSKKSSKIVYIDNTDYINEVDDKEESKVNSLYLWSVVDGLKGRSKDVIILKYFNDLTIKEISETLECPVGTVKTYLNKGLTGLRKEISKESV